MLQLDWMYDSADCSWARVVRFLWNQEHQSSLMHALNYDRFCTSEQERFISKHFVLYFCLSAGYSVRLQVRVAGTSRWLQRPRRLNVNERKLVLVCICALNVYVTTTKTTSEVWNKSRSQGYWIQPFWTEPRKMFFLTVTQYRTPSVSLEMKSNWQKRATWSGTKKDKCYGKNLLTAW